MTSPTQRLNEIAWRLKFEANSTSDITWLLEEVRVLRDALEVYAKEDAWAFWFSGVHQNKHPNERAKSALEGERR